MPNHPKDIVADACTNEEECGVVIECNYLDAKGGRIGQERVDTCPICGAGTRPVNQEEFDILVDDNEEYDAED